MILVGNQRGGAKNLALHLLKDENDHVELHEIRGFASENLMAALNEIYAISRGTRCKQFLYSLSLNPPPGEIVEKGKFETAIERIERKLKLDGQPRAIVFHEKNGRRHCHCVWSRIDTETMTAVNLPFTKNKLQEISRELFLENGWQLPSGFIKRGQPNPMNFSHAEWQQAKRIGKDPRAIKTALQDCWAVSDTQESFTHALKERGYVLARGDRRGFVVIDHRGEIFSVPKMVGIKTKEVRARLTDKKSLPSVDEASAQITDGMLANLERISLEQNSVFLARLDTLKKHRQSMIYEHRAEREELERYQQALQQEESATRQQRYRKGLRGWLDRFTGRSKKIKLQNEADYQKSLERDRQEKESTVLLHLENRLQLENRIQRLQSLKYKRVESIGRDIAQYQGIRKQRLEQFDVERQVNQSNASREDTKHSYGPSR